MDSDRRDLLPSSAPGVVCNLVAAELAGVGIQTLRLYEQHGLLTPASAGGTPPTAGTTSHDSSGSPPCPARASNLAGIARILELEDANTALTAERDRLQQHHDQA